MVIPPSVVVFDEAHHCDGNHVYAELLDMIHLIPDQRRPRILGLTASPFNAKKLEQGCGMMDPIHPKKDKRLSRILGPIWGRQGYTVCDFNESLIQCPG